MRKTNLKFWHGMLVMGLIALFLFLRSCNNNRKFTNAISDINAYQDTVKHYKTKNGTIVDYNNNLETTLEAFMAATSDSMRVLLANLKIPKPEVITVIKERFYIDSIPSVGLNISNCTFDTTFSIRQRYYEVKGKVNNKELLLQSILIPNTISLVIGDHKDKWYKKREYIATVTNSNPYISTESIKSFTLKETQSRWSIGPNIGYGFYYDPSKGTAGHGLTGGISINYRLLGWKKK